MKRILAFILVVVFVFALTGRRAKNTKSDIFTLVEEHYDAILKACEEKDEDALLAIKGITKVNIIDGYVIVFCKGSGISVSSQDYGFYYSAENIPIAVNCNLGIVCRVEGLTPEENGYQCTVRGNTFYTEHIKGNIYFYSNAY